MSHWFQKNALPMVLCAALWVGLSVWKPFGTTSSDWLQVAMALLLAYSVTIHINNDSKNREIRLSIVEQMEKNLSMIEDLLESNNISKETIHTRIIPKTSSVTTIVSFFQKEYLNIGKSGRQTERHIKGDPRKDAIESFGKEFNVFRECISEIVDNFSEKERFVERALNQVQKCKISLLKIKIAIYS